MKARSPSHAFTKAASSEAAARSAVAPASGITARRKCRSGCDSISLRMRSCSARITFGQAPKDPWFRKVASSASSKGWRIDRPNGKRMETMSGCLEVDEATRDIGMRELHAHALADAKSLEPAHDASLGRRAGDTHKCSLLGSARHDAVELRADARREENRRRGLRDLPLDPRGVVLL